MLIIHFPFSLCQNNPGAGIFGNPNVPLNVSQGQVISDNETNIAGEMNGQGVSDEQVRGLTYLTIKYKLEAYYAHISMVMPFSRYFARTLYLLTQTNSKHKR